jgi:hypothetical protein
MRLLRQTPEQGRGGRNPKPETRNPKEGRNPKAEDRGACVRNAGRAGDEAEDGTLGSISASLIHNDSAAKDCGGLPRSPAPQPQGVTDYYEVGQAHRRGAQDRTHETQRCQRHTDGIVEKGPE